MGVGGSIVGVAVGPGGTGVGVAKGVGLGGTDVRVGVAVGGVAEAHDTTKRGLCAADAELAELKPNSVALLPSPLNTRP